MLFRCTALLTCSLGDDEAGGGETFFFFFAGVPFAFVLPGPWLALGELQEAVAQSWRCAAAQSIVISAELGGSEVGMSLLVEEASRRPLPTPDPDMFSLLTSLLHL